MIDNMSHDACQSRFCSPSLCPPLFAIPSDFILFIHISSMVDRFYSTKMYAFTCGRYQKKCLPLGDVDIESLGSLQRAWHATWLGLSWFDSINRLHTSSVFILFLFRIKIKQLLEFGTWANMWKLTWACVSFAGDAAIAVAMLMHTFFFVVVFFAFHYRFTVGVENWVKCFISLNEFCCRLNLFTLYWCRLRRSFVCNSISLCLSLMKIVSFTC